MNYRTIRRALLAVPAIAAVGLATLSMPATALPAAALATCSTVSVATDITPPLGPTAASITAAGQGGTATCSGTVDGATIDSSVPAVFGLTANSPSSSCTNVGGGDGEFSLVVTDQAGASHTITGTFSWVAGAQGSISLSGQLSAAGGLRPITGDCVSSPLSRAGFELRNATVSV